MNYLKKIGGLLRKTAVSYSRDNGSMLAASVAYYTIFAIAPLLVIAVAVAGIFFGQTAVEGDIVNAIQGTVGKEAAVLIQALIASASRSDATIFATIISTLLLIYGASGLFLHLQQAINLVWGIPPSSSEGIIGFLQKRLLTFVMVLLVGVLLLLSLVSSTVLTALSSSLSGWLPHMSPLLPRLEIFVSGGILILLFALLFKMLPDAHVAWRDVFLGALVTAVLFTIGEFLISYYLSYSSSNPTYQAAGSIVILLLWVYYSAQIVLFGAEFTQVYANTYGSKVRSTTQPDVIFQASHPPRPNAAPSPAAPTATTAVVPPQPWRKPVASGLLGVAFGLLLAFLGNRMTGND